MSPRYATPAWRTRPATTVCATRAVSSESVPDANGSVQLVALISEGIATGEFAEVDARAAGIRIFIAVDGGGSYVNTTAPTDHPAHVHFARDVAEWTLGLAPGTLTKALPRRAG